MQQPDLPLAEQIRAVRREIGFRRRLYPGWVRKGAFSLTQEKADHEIRAMQSVLHTLLRLQNPDLLGSQEDDERPDPPRPF